ncbi:MAG: chromosomal replication initiator protein DnaA [Candidatus Mcinerneyibacterium aminivorans]|jgi:chromosomal replication initiator protein|uniref:Chromosomal replication initiator protein DnaA n=1 Tax=Candidatus Mcinerneyibacterium aminivorans TaxID=2703815 RepID=A0A5D0MKV4_9BACT|nr:MAG: chromosomal replication initiator protein DnaA [Candidatus Mcinerneyibacterium aminivorans]
MSNLKEYIMDQLSIKVDKGNVENLFSEINVVKDDKKVRFESSDEVFLKRIRLLFEDDLNYILQNKSNGDNLELEFKITDKFSKSNYSEGSQEKSYKKESFSTDLNDNFIFNNFVIGRSNEMSYSAAVAVAKNVGQSIYNPLFIYGESGLGKTHLMQAIGNKIYKKKKEEVRCCYVTADKFRNELIESIKNRSTENFRNKYRYVDVLLVDDIHVIEGAESVQEEFFHTFNDLYKLNKQIVITSDRPPSEIKLENRLITRFEWGLVTDIKKPRLETRVAILKKKAEKWNMNLSHEIIFYIANNVTSNVRKLEGCLRRISFYSRISGTTSDLTVNDINALLSEFFDNNLQKMSLSMIKEKVAEYYGLTVNVLESKRRKREFVIPRFVAMFIAREHTNETLKSIGKSFGDRDHSSVINACNRIEEMMDEDITFKNEIEKVITYLNK